MTSAIRVPAAVLLPGTGSDEVVVRTVFGGPLAALGIPLTTPKPLPGAAAADGFRAALDHLADEHGTLLVGGISFGAHLAAEWAIENPGRCHGLLAALPAWNGAPADAPAALAATLTADLVAGKGTGAAIAQARASSPKWLADELSRAWHRHGDGLADALRAAATRTAPTVEELHGLDVPTGIGACTDDPVHPAKIAHTWATALPHATYRETTLTALGDDPESLGRATVLAYLNAL